MTRIAFLMLAFVLLPSSIAAQERNTGFMVHQLCVASNDGVAAANAMSETTSPILEALREEGMISAWFELRHGWGDEWNVGTVTVAESPRAWLDFWSEFLTRVRAEDPGLIGRMNASCELHKDNMYNVRNMGVGE
jgi:hypothetical protein